MGTRNTLSPADIMSKPKSALARSKSIDHQINEDKERRQREIQLLILGGASSGKSTFIKQMRFHFGDGYPDSERRKYISQVRSNLTDVLHVISYHMKALSVDYAELSVAALMEEIKNKFPKITMTYLLSQLTDDEDSISRNGRDRSPSCRQGNSSPEVTQSDLNDINRIWRDKGVQVCLSRKKEWERDQLSESEQHFVANMERICSKDYIPSVQDILYIRKPTLGVQEHKFNIDSLIYRVIDVAGQKSQRKKWIHFFDEVTAVIFLASLSGYTERLEEDKSVNNLQDSLELFREVSHNHFLEKTDFILFLNKHDIFLEKIQTRSLTECFPKYRGDSSGDSSIHYIKDQFMQRKPANKQVYMHLSCATDVNMMKNLLANVLDIIIEMNLRKTGMC